VQTGDGAAFAAPDVGQMGNNPCNDPPEYRGAFRVQNPNKLNGKIVRMNPNTLEWEVYATGVRNPFRMTWYNDMLLQSDTGWYS
jgi:glucose/arabinose dehydrogenase